MAPTDCAAKRVFRSIVVAFAVLMVSARPCRALEQEKASEKEQDQNPNIVFILADDLGYGDLGCYGQQRIQTPNLDRMAAEGMLFTQFYAGSSVCAPSRCALMTGLHTGHCYIRANGKFSLRPGDVTVAELLKSAGYVTGAVGKWGLGQEGSEGVPTRQGFDYFFGYLDQEHAHNYYPHFMIRNEERVPLRNVVPDPGSYGQGVATEKVEYSHNLLTIEALDFIESNRDTSFFLYLAYIIPHINNEAYRRGLEAWEVPDHGIYQDRDWPGKYKSLAAMITRMDADIGKMLRLLEELGIDERTIVMFSSDNGPAPPSLLDPEFFVSSGPLRGYKGTLYEGGIRVPFLARWPGVIKPGMTSDHVAGFQDVMPTLADIAGLNRPEGIDGISLLPVLLDQPVPRPEHDYLYWELAAHPGWFAVRMGEWKAVVSPVEFPLWFPLWVNKTLLYNLNDDPGEKVNLADQYPETIKGMRTIIKASHEPPLISDFAFRLPRRKLAAGLAGIIVIAGLAYLAVRRVRRSRSVQTG